MKIHTPFLTIVALPVTKVNSAESIHSSVSANSEDESDSEYVPSDGENSDESADGLLIENAEEMAAMRDLV